MESGSEVVRMMEVEAVLSIRWYGDVGKASTAQRQFLVFGHPNSVDRDTVTDAGTDLEMKIKHCF